MNTTHHELLPTLLLRAANGNRPLEAAIILLTQTELLDQLSTAIIIDPDHNLARIDWPTLHHHANQTTSDTRAVLLLAATLATHAQHLQPDHHNALHHAINHLTHQPPDRSHILTTTPARSCSTEAATSPRTP